MYLTWMVGGISKFLGMIASPLAEPENLCETGLNGVERLMVCGSLLDAICNWRVGYCVCMCTYTCAIVCVSLEGNHREASGILGEES